MSGFQNLQNFVFLDETDTTGESNTLNVDAGSLLGIRVEADEGETIDLSVMGNSDFESETFYPLGAFGYADLKKTESIDAAGEYIVPVNTIGLVKIVNNGTAGNCKVFGKLRG